MSSGCCRCGPRFLVSEDICIVIPFCQRKRNLCFPCRTATWLRWANLVIRSVTCFISLPCNYWQTEKLSSPVFIHIIQTWGLGLERLNLCSLFAAKVLQSTRDKINSFLLRIQSYLLIKKRKCQIFLLPISYVQACEGYWSCFWSSTPPLSKGCFI